LFNKSSYNAGPCNRSTTKNINATRRTKYNEAYSGFTKPFIYEVRSMNTVVENLTGMSPLTDQVIASDMLIAAKAGIKNYAVAITESATTEVRNTLKQQLNDAINYHEQISNYMISKGYYNPHDVSKQIKMDISASQVAINLVPKQ
jgi:similar to spore coat protein